jgi:predicted RNA polymerase sigma factor
MTSPSLRPGTIAPSEPTRRTSHGLLERLALCSNPAIWPSAQIALVLHDGFALPIAHVARLIGKDPAAVTHLLSRARRRIQALNLSGLIASGREWPDQLARMRRLVAAVADLGAIRTRQNPEQGLDLCRIAVRLAGFLTDHPLSGTPESHELRQWTLQSFETCDRSVRQRAIRV